MHKDSGNESDHDSTFPVESRLTGTAFLLVNAMASCFPGMGGVVSELIGRKREERIRQFTEMLEARIDNIEKHLDIFSQPACIELLEEAADQASRGESELKRIALARIMATSINEDLVNHETDRLLLALLGDMTDYELLHLLDQFQQSLWTVNEDYANLLQNSQEIVKPRVAYDLSGQEKSDAYHVQMAHHSRLERFGLLKNECHSNRPRYNSTPLARLLLRRMNAISEPD